MFYDYTAKRYDIQYDTGDFYGGLHCGECLKAYYEYEWKDTRIEYDHDNKEWYLVGLPCGLDGMQVKIN